MKKINDENKDPQKPEVYYYKDGLYIQMPKAIVQMGHNEKNLGKKHLAMNLLNEFQVKKEKNDKYQSKLTENSKKNIDNIMVRTERFLLERQVI